MGALSVRYGEAASSNFAANNISQLKLNIGGLESFGFLAVWTFRQNLTRLPHYCERCGSLKGGANNDNL